MWYIYPTKKETHHYDFPIKFSFLYENVNCHEIFISDQILLKLKCGVDEHLYLPCVGMKHSEANGKRVFGSIYLILLSTWNIEYVLHLRSMENIGCRYVRQPNVFIDVFFLFQYPFTTVRTV